MQDFVNHWPFSVKDNNIRSTTIKKRCFCENSMTCRNKFESYRSFSNLMLKSIAEHFEMEINQLRTYQGQSDVVEINPKGTILPFMFGGGANSAATEVLGDRAIFSSDFGGNPPYQKMKDIANICYKHFLKQANIVQIIGGKANNTDIHNASYSSLII